jgi:hypothetical protein
VELVRLDDGTILVVEVKTRKRLPALLRAALDQAKRYGPDDAVPVAVVSELGGEALAVVPLRAFAALVGVAAAPKKGAQTCMFVEPTTTLVELAGRVA